MLVLEARVHFDLEKISEAEAGFGSGPNYNFVDT
jgi:hypothetical protein